MTLDPVVDIFSDNQSATTDFTDFVLPNTNVPIVQSSAADPEPTTNDPSNNNVVPSVLSEPRYPVRIHRNNVRLTDFETLFLTNLLSLYEPRFYKEASVNPLWQKAMAEELHALEKNQT